MTSYQQDKRIPEGPYFVTDDDAEDCPDHSHSGLAKVDTGEMIASIPEMLTTIADQRAEIERWKEKALDLEGRIANALL